jgi:LysM repeat protein
MRSTLAALVLATALPLAGVLSPAARAQQAVVVRSGETLSEIADRHGVSLSRLMQANGISNADLVQVGQRLTIPGGASAVSRPVISAGGTYTVKDGETLSEIADRQGISLSRLMQANGIGNADLVQVGQRLTIPGNAAVAARPSQPTAPYTVKSGETLSDLAARFDTSTERLMQINAIRDPDLVVSGTRLQVPLVPGRRPSAGNSAAPKTNANASAGNRQATEHTVQSGESLSLIAERYGTSVDRLAALNQLQDPALLQVGTRLKLRGTPQTARPASSAAPIAAKPSPAKQATAAASATKPVQSTTTPLPSRLSQTTSAIPSATTTASAATASAAKASAAPASVATASAAPAAAATKTVAAAAAATTPAATPAATIPTRSAAATAPAQAQSSTTSATLPATATTAARPLNASTRPSTGAAIATTTSPSTAARGVTRSSSNSGSLASARPTNGDWRSYGPLQVDWSNLQPMGGSFVAPSVNGDGQALYVAVNCTARKLNVTSQAGQWKTWESPGQDFEQRLVQDICLAKAS